MLKPYLAALLYNFQNGPVVNIASESLPLPLHQEPGQKASQPGQAKFSGFLAELTGKVWPGKAW